jgi:hypothetical protein
LRYLEAGIGLGPGGEQRRPFALDGLAIVAQFSQKDDAPAGVGTAGREPCSGASQRSAMSTAPVPGRRFLASRWSAGTAASRERRRHAVDYATRS